MFQMTQGGGEGEPVVTSPKNDKFDNYLIALEKSGIDDRITEARIIYEMWDQRVRETEYQLRISRSVHDQIYIKRWVDHKGVTRIGKEVGYSERQTRRIIKKMSENVRLAVI